MKTTPAFHEFSDCIRLAVALAMVSALPMSALVLDDFEDGIRTGWTDYILDQAQATVTEKAGLMSVEIASTDQIAFVGSIYNSRTFDLLPGKRIELRIDLAHASSPNLLAQLAWIPTGDTNFSSGYSISKSHTAIVVAKGADKIFTRQQWSGKNDNLTLALALSLLDSDVSINAKVIDKDKNDVLFNETFIDKPGADQLALGIDEPSEPYVGPGNFDLGVRGQIASGAPALIEVLFDNAAVLIPESYLVDDFNDNINTSWIEHDDGRGLGMVFEAKKRLMLAVPFTETPPVKIATHSSRAFMLDNGLQFQVDLLKANDPDALAVLGIAAIGYDLADLPGYWMAMSSKRILIGKSLNNIIFEYAPAIPLKNENVKLVFSLLGTIEKAKIDIDILDIDNNNEVLFHKSLIDQTKRFLRAGMFMLAVVGNNEQGQHAFYQVDFDNANASPPLITGSGPPKLLFYHNEVFTSFTERGHNAWFELRMHAGVEIYTQLNSSRIFSEWYGYDPGEMYEYSHTVQPFLSRNKDYVLAINAVHADGGLTITNMYFDTFLPDNRTIEIEDYNYSGGYYIDWPVVTPEPSPEVPNSYRKRSGIRGIDYGDTSTDAANNAYRPSDPMGIERTRDSFREHYSEVLQLYDYDLCGIESGEYLNYTRSFTNGAYAVYLRQSLSNVARSIVALEKVTSNPAQPNQDTHLLGVFFGNRAEPMHRNYPLTDGLGKTNLVLRLSGVETLRLRQLTSDPATDSIRQNYMVFLPVQEPDIQRPIITIVSPLPDAVVEEILPTVSAQILNRDNSVDVSSIQVYFDDEPVVPSVSTQTTGITLTCRPDSIPAPYAVHSVRIVFADDQNVQQTNVWLFGVSWPEQWLPEVQLESSVAPGGPFVTEQPISIDSSDRTITALAKGDMRFYRIRYSGPPVEPLALKFLNIKLQGEKVVLAYDLFSSATD